MKNLAITLLVFLLLIFSNQAQAKAKIPICFPCEKVSLVHDFKKADKINLGYLYEEYSIAFLPIYNSSGKYVLFNHSSYSDISSKELEAIKKEADIHTLPKHAISLWRKILGKILGFIVLGFIIAGYLLPNEDEES